MSSVSADAPKAESGEWLSPKQALALLSTRAGITQASAAITILDRLDAGMILSRAKKVLIDPRRQRPMAGLRQRLQHYFQENEIGEDRVYIHRDFWSAAGSSEPGQNVLATGDFSIQIERIEIRIFGIEFDKAGILEILGQGDLPPPAGEPASASAPKSESEANHGPAADQAPTFASATKGKGGRPRGPDVSKDEEISREYRNIKAALGRIDKEDRKILKSNARLARRLAEDPGVTSSVSTLEKMVGDRYPPWGPPRNYKL